MPITNTDALNAMPLELRAIATLGDIESMRHRLERQERERGDKRRDPERGRVGIWNPHVKIPMRGVDYYFTPFNPAHEMPPDVDTPPQPVKAARRPVTLLDLETQPLAIGLDGKVPVEPVKAETGIEMMCEMHRTLAEGGFEDTGMLFMGSGAKRGFTVRAKVTVGNAIQLFEAIYMSTHGIPSEQRGKIEGRKEAPKLNESITITATLQPDGKIDVEVRVD